MLSHPMKRPGRILRDLLRYDTLVFPGVFNSISALSAVNAGAQGLYISGAGISNAQLGVPDVGMASLNEFAQAAARICSVSPVPVISDADTGFGEAWNTMRTVVEMERAGLAGIHLEDQVNPKRCGHLDGKGLISVDHFVSKIKAAVHAKADPDFLIIARTDARGVEGLESAIERARAYVKAGADAVFPEGLETIEEFRTFREAVRVPLLANMTEFGKTPIIPVSQFRNLGYEMVIFPMTAFRTMLKTLDETYAELIHSETQSGLLDKMRTRTELYDLIEYPQYEKLDQIWAEDS